jgi:acetyl-CoA carboxylase carboxyl transferase subunit alpha
MASNAAKEKFAYDFEAQVVEVEKEISELIDKAIAEGKDLTAEVKELEARRDKLLKEMVEGLTAYQRVKLARHPLRPHPVDYIRAISGDYLELHGDRRFGDDKAIITALGKVGETRVMWVAQHKGKETREKMAANFGMPQPEGYRKALQKMKLAEKFDLPVICLIDTPGAAPAVGAEERGQAEAIAENIFEMSGLRVPVIIIVTGEGCSGGALGIGVGDRFAMMENAYYSVISPEGCAAILYKDGEMADKAAEAMKLTAKDMLEAEVIEEIIPEPLGGAHRDAEQAVGAVKEFLTKTLSDLQDKPVDDLLDNRYARYRKLGVFVEGEAETEAATENGE